MQITRPDYYKEFTCIADVCPDTCCAGWQIVIDEKSLKKYRRVKGPFRGLEGAGFPPVSQTLCIFK